MTDVETTAINASKRHPLLSDKTLAKKGNGTMRTIKSNNKATTRTTIVNAGMLAAAATIATLVIVTVGHAQSDHDPERCDAYFTLAGCDREECVARNQERYEGDETRVALGEHRCDARFRKALRRPNRKYDCGFNTCDVDVFAPRIGTIEDRYFLCEARNEILEMGPAHMQGCTDRCDKRLARVRALADVNNCENVEIAESCEPF